LTAMSETRWIYYIEKGGNCFAPEEGRPRSKTDLTGYSPETPATGVGKGGGGKARRYFLVRGRGEKEKGTDSRKKGVGEEGTPLDFVCSREGGGGKGKMGGIHPECGEGREGKRHLKKLQKEVKCVGKKRRNQITSALSEREVERQNWRSFWLLKWGV